MLSLIWLDTEIDESSSLAKNLRQYELFQCFKEQDQCVDYIRQNSNQDIALICSGSLGKTIVPSIYGYQNLKKIYVFCGEIRVHVEWAINFEERILLFDHDSDLLERIWNDLAEYFDEKVNQFKLKASQARERAKVFKASCTS